MKDSTGAPPGSQPVPSCPTRIAFTCFRVFVAHKPQSTHRTTKHNALLPGAAEQLCASIAKHSYMYVQCQLAEYTLHLQSSAPIITTASALPLQCPSNCNASRIYINSHAAAAHLLRDDSPAAAASPAPIAAPPAAATPARSAPGCCCCCSWPAPSGRGFTCRCRFWLCTCFSTVQSNT